MTQQGERKYANQIIQTEQSNDNLAMKKTMEHLSEFVFISMANLTLASRDAYLTHVRSSIKPDTLSAPRKAPLHMVTLFNSSLKKVEEYIAHYEDKGY